MKNDHAEKAQRGLLAALYSDAGRNANQDSDVNPKALEVYRNNLYASALRALTISYPTLFLLCGEDFFRTQSLKYLSRHPFKEGDWGEWGGELPAFLRSSETHYDYPYFSCVAELDWLHHLTERDPDQQLDPLSFELLASENASQCRLVLSPSVRILTSSYPVVDIFDAHQQGKDAKRYMAFAREKMAAGIGQNALIYRPLSKACIESCPHNEMPIFQAITDGHSFARISEYAQTLTSFDFDAWLTLCVERKIILGVKL